MFFSWLLGNFFYTCNYKAVSKVASFVIHTYLPTPKSHERGLLDHGYYGEKVILKCFTFNLNVHDLRYLLLRHPLR